MVRRAVRFALPACALLFGACAADVHRDHSAAQSSSASLRVASFNSSLNDDHGGGLINRLRAGDTKARKIAAVLQRVRPDIVLLNEFDYDSGHQAETLFLRDYLGVGQFGERALSYSYHYSAEVNTGVVSGLDIDGNGTPDSGPADAWGFGRHPGQYGMLVLSQFPIDARKVRTFQHFLWHDMPGALRPELPGAKSRFYNDDTWKRLRLSSKSHWDVPIDTPSGTLHFLVDHPTPPVFDGPDDRNGQRNHDEIRLWADYISGDPNRSGYLHDDQDGRGGLSADARFVIAGDHNADPNDGAAYPGAIAQLLAHPAIRSTPIPASAGAAEASHLDGGANAAQRGDPGNDTGSFESSVGNLRLDYVLPSRNFQIVDSGVFWPTVSQPEHAWVDASDHHLVWVDLRW